MIAAERQEQIINQLRINKVVSVHELAQQFKTTDMTIRRDLALLEKKGLLTRSYGGAVFNGKVGNESDFIIRCGEKPDIKAMIGRKAASLVTPGDSIGIDVGTTGLEVAKHVRDIEDLSVLTASIPVVNELAGEKNVKVICTGGELSSKDLSLTGHTATRMLQEYILDKVFIGVAGISFDHGFTLFNMQDALVKRVFIERALEVIIVCHSDKIGVAKHASLCDIDVASKIITDSGISENDYRTLESYGVKVILADVDEEDPADQEMESGDSADTRPLCEIGE
ncbi:MAG: DeoR/GlpR family DNA-binding transcription regulator [Oscillospiraceae bacterium]|nr:DeoR/GlpR family DNA-binding transcription regulator [Oscillospiraceae bacterium]